MTSRPVFTRYPPRVDMFHVVELSVFLVVESKMMDEIKGENLSNSR